MCTALFRRPGLLLRGSAVASICTKGIQTNHGDLAPCIADGVLGLLPALPQAFLQRRGCTPSTSSERCDVLPPSISAGTATKALFLVQFQQIVLLPHHGDTILGAPFGPLKITLVSLCSFVFDPKGFHYWRQEIESMNTSLKKARENFPSASA